VFHNKGYRCAAENLQLVWSTHKRVCLWNMPLKRRKVKTKINNIESISNVYIPQALLSASEIRDIPAVMFSSARSSLT